ncbi:Peptidase S1 domain-containing protein [Sergentomyia squamirostris]
MWLLVFLCSAHLMFTSASLSGKIVGGVNADPGQFPYMVSIQWAPNAMFHHLCGGSILNEEWVLTAAHCNFMTFQHQLMKVIVGAWDFRTPSLYQQEAWIDRFVDHPLYQGGNGVPHNIAVVHVDEKFTFNSWVQPVILPTTSSYPFGAATLTGWGWTADEPPFLLADILQSVNVSLITASQCFAALVYLGENPLELDSISHICTGPLTGGISACNGDMGGPLVQNDENNIVQVGMAIRIFRPCGRHNAPTIYIRVSAYVDWIRSFIN